MDNGESIADGQVKHTQNADLIIVDECERQHHVSRNVLTSSSPVFGAMFRPDFAEGQAVLNATANSLPVIRLSDDDPWALHTLFQLLHRHELPSTFTADSMIIKRVQRLGEVADKYQCTAALAPFTSSMFEGIEAATPGPENEFSNKNEMANLHDLGLIRAAWLLDDAEYFQRYTDILLKTGQSERIGIDRDDPDRNRMCKALNYHNKECAQYLLKRIADLVAICALYLRRLHPAFDQQGKSNPTRQCDAEQRVAARYMEKFVRNDLWPATDSDLDYLQFVRRGIELLEEPNLDGIERCHGAHSAKSPVKQEVDLIMGMLQERARTMWVGICLDCLKHPDVVAAVCRVPHTKCSLGRDMPYDEADQPVR